MKFSQLFTKTTKDISSQIESKNAQLLIRSGFIYQELAGVYAFLPLGWRVISKIEQIVRSEMDKIACELHLSSLSPIERWQDTKRHEGIDVLMSTKAANQISLGKSRAEYILNPTHEDVITPIAKKYASSYKDLPFATYQIQTKFRNEARAKSGLLRGREFIMKDLYSFHEDEKGLREFYEVVKQSYWQIYKKLGIADDTYLTLASGGDFTKDYSHEFQTLLEVGEDIIYIDEEKSIAYNQEVVDAKNANRLKVDFNKMKQKKASEVGNIFPLGTKFSELLQYHFTDSKGKSNLVWMGSYGIGISRIMGVIAEKFADAKGLVWPKNIAPFSLHLVSLHKEPDRVADKLYKNLPDCIYDDRQEVSPGTKLADADLIGCPIRIVVSEKTLEKDSVEISSRTNEFKTAIIKTSDLAKWLDQKSN